MSNLREYLGLRAPKTYRSSKQKSGVDPELLYGVELEIEGLEGDEDLRANRVVAGMQYHKDGSLRNNGGEFVTLPMDYANLEEVLTNFFKVNEYTEENYSERCSVHVHANCQDLELSQIRLVLCLYQVLEKILFQYIAEERHDNIFCVPLGESNLGTRIMASDEDLLQVGMRKWRKYTALNLLPLGTQGTIEFRHMAGTKDLEFILQWCQIIGSLFKYARQNKFEEVIKSIMTLNTSSAYATFMQNIFDGELYEVLTKDNWREYLEEGVINMKCMLAPRQKATTKNYYEVDGLGEAAFAIPARDARLPRANWTAHGGGYQQEIDRENLQRLEEGRPFLDRTDEAHHLTTWLARVEEDARVRRQLARAQVIPQPQAVQAQLNNAAAPQRWADIVNRAGVAARPDPVLRRNPR